MDNIASIDNAASISWGDGGSVVAMLNIACIAVCGCEPRPSFATDASTLKTQSCQLSVGRQSSVVRASRQSNVRVVSRVVSEFVNSQHVESTA